MRDNNKPAAAANSRLKLVFDIIFVIGLVLLIIKLVVLVLDKVVGLDVPAWNDKFIWNIGPLALMVIGGIGSGALREKEKRVSGD